MKLKSLYKAFILFMTAVVFTACNDTLDEVGFSIQPDKDRLSVGLDTLMLEARTVAVGSFFSKTTYPVLGEYIDPVFGSVKSDYIGEFYLSSGAEFKSGAVIDSVRAVVSYSTILGDSLSPMRLSVYEVTKSIRDSEAGTNIDPKNYSDMSAPLGEQIFTGKNSTYHTETYTSGYTTRTVTVYDIPVTLPNAIGEKFLAEYQKTGHGKMANTDTFREFFPGLYFTTTFGDATVLEVNLTSLYVHYHYLDAGGSSKGTDTIRTDAMRLNITPEVTQINYIENKNDQLLADNDTYSYVKSPAGVNTEITFPLSKIHSKLESQALNLAKFTVYAMPDPTEDVTVKLSPPTYLLLINKDSLNGFFEQRKLSDNVTSFISATFDESTYSYTFDNLSTMINHYNEAIEGAYDLTYYLIPVDATYTTVQQSYYSSSYQVLTALHNRMWPSAAILDKRKGSMRLELIFSNF